MTYCVGILVRDGLVFASDSRTNAGVDQIATFRKLAAFGVPGDRFMALLSAGNLATTQAVVTRLGERLQGSPEAATLKTVKSMYEAAQLVGDTLRGVLQRDTGFVEAQDGDPHASFILGGQIKGRPVRLFQIYSAGNFIEASPETPFFQIGEMKYGKPILDRIITYDVPLMRAAMAALVSFDSTMRSNLSVAPPIDLMVVRDGALKPELRLEVNDGDTYFGALRRAYGQGIVALFDSLPKPDWPLG